MSTPKPPETPQSLTSLTAEVAACRQEASYATSGGEGMAAMVSVRVAQAKLAHAYIAAADAAHDSAVQREHLEHARATLAEVLGSQQAEYHRALVPVLAAVEARLR